MQDIFPDWLSPYLPLLKSVALAIAIFVGGWIASKIAAKAVRGLLTRRKIDQTVVRFLGSLTLYAGVAATIIAALGAVGVETTSLVAVFASAGLAVGLALQGSLANFASGVLILIQRPIAVDDVVEVAGKAGRVDEIGLFATTLVTLDNERITIPNAKITGDTVTNFTVLGTRRGSVDVGVAYGSDVGKVMEALSAAAKSVGEVLDDPAPAVAFVGLGASSLDFTVLTWCKAPDYLAMLSNLRRAIYEKLDEAGIEIPFNQIVVHQAA